MNFAFTVSEGKKIKIILEAFLILCISDGEHIVFATVSQKYEKVSSHRRKSSFYLKVSREVLALQ